MAPSIHHKIQAILADERLAREDYPRPEILEAAYGADNIEEAIYELRHTWGIRTLYRVLTDYLGDKRFKPHWDICQVVLWYLVMDLDADRAGAFIDADFLIALLHFRRPDEDEGDRIWSIYCKLKKVPPWSYNDPLADPGIQTALTRLKRTGSGNDTEPK